MSRQKKSDKQKLRRKDRDRDFKPLAFIILSFFFLSGAAGLIYEILWTRMIHNVIGSAPFAVASILVVFMGGLALGSYLAGRKVDLIPDKRSLLALYGKLEIGIGLYALVLPVLLVMATPVYELAYNKLFEWFWFYNFLCFIGLFLLLIIPVSFMGATLPILCRFYILEVDHLGSRSGRLYGLNTVGAAIGAFLCGFILIRALGIWGTLFVATGINLLVGLSCLILSRIPAPLLVSIRKKPHPGASLPGGSLPPAETKRGLHQARLAVWIFAVSGFCAMAYEVIWTRLLGLLIGPTVYAFSLVLASFILGLGVGSLIFGRIADRVKGVFSLLIGTQISAALLAVFVSHFLGNSQFFFAKLIFTFRNDFNTVVMIQSLVVFAILLCPALLLGATFPLVNKLYARQLPEIGKSIGKAYALNTIGAISGSFAAGFLLIPVFGKEHGIQLVIGIQLAAAVAVSIVGLAHIKKRALPGLAIFGALVLGLIVLSNFPAWDRQVLSYGRYHNFSGLKGDLFRISWLESVYRGTEILSRHEKGRDIVFYGDGLGGFTTVEEHTDSFGTTKYTLLTSGKPDASSHGDRSTQTLLAHVPLVFHPDPENVMILGLGSGMTAGEALLYPIKRLDVLEINKEVVKACRFFEPWNNNCLNDPRCRIVLQDGRNHLTLTDRTYDVIISEPSNPWMAGLADLYTLDFFRTIKGRLREHGIFVQWIHSYEMDWKTFALVGRTFSKVFPQGLLMTTLTGEADFLLVGFKDGQGFDPKVAEDNFRFAANSENITLPGPKFLFHLIITEDLKKTFGNGPLHTNSRPRLEFAAPRLLYSQDAGINRKIIQNRSLSPNTMKILDKEDSARVRLDMFEFSASAFSPVFSIVDPGELNPARRKRYLDILDRYCGTGLVSDYTTILDEESRERCACLQADGIRSHISQNPGDAWAYFSLGLALRQTEDKQAAVQAFRDAVSRDPYNARAFNQIGLTLMDMGEIEKARKSFLKAMRANPAHASAYFNLARITYSQGKEDETLEYLRKGLQYEDNARARELLRSIRPSD